MCTRLTHVVVNIMCIQCVGEVYTVCVPLEHQDVCSKDQSYGNMMHVQRINL